MKVLNALFFVTLCNLSMVHAKQMGQRITPPKPVINYPQEQPTIQPTASKKADKTYQQFLDEIRSMKNNQLFKSNGFLTDHAVELMKNIDNSSLAAVQKRALNQAIYFLHMTWTDIFMNDQKRLDLIINDANTRAGIGFMEQDIIQKEQPINMQQDQPLPLISSFSPKLELKEDKPQPKSLMPSEQTAEFDQYIRSHLDTDENIKQFHQELIKKEYENASLSLYAFAVKLKSYLNQNSEKYYALTEKSILNLLNRTIDTKFKLAELTTGEYSVIWEQPINYLLNEKKPAQTQKGWTIPDQRESLTAFINQVLNEPQGKNFQIALKLKDYKQAGTILEEIAERIRSKLVYENYTLGSGGALRILRPIVDQKFNLSKQTLGEENYYMIWKDAEFVLE